MVNAEKITAAFEAMTAQIELVSMKLNGASDDELSAQAVKVAMLQDQARSLPAPERPSDAKVIRVYVRDQEVPVGALDALKDALKRANILVME